MRGVGYAGLHQRVCGEGYVRRDDGRLFDEGPRVFRLVLAAHSGAGGIADEHGDGEGYVSVGGTGDSVDLVVSCTVGLGGKEGAIVGGAVSAGNGDVGNSDLRNGRRMTRTALLIGPSGKQRGVLRGVVGGKRKVAEEVEGSTCLDLRKPTAGGHSFSCPLRIDRD
jgi:hypothetical protein